MADTAFDPADVPGTAEYDHRTVSTPAPTTKPESADIPHGMDEDEKPAPKRHRASAEAPDIEPPAEPGTAGEEN